MNSRLLEYLQTLGHSEIDDLLANVKPEPLKRKAAPATKWTDLNDFFEIGLQDADLNKPPEDPLDAFYPRPLFENTLHLSRDLFLKPCLDAFARCLITYGLPKERNTESARINLAEPVTDLLLDLCE
jgi:hypothetical protein